MESVTNSSAALLLCPCMSHRSQQKNRQETVWQSLQLEPEFYSKMRINAVLGHQFYPMNPSMPKNFAFSNDEKKKAQGTELSFKMRIISRKMNLCGESQQQFPDLGNGKAKFSDSYHPHPSVLERHEYGSHGHQLREVALPEVSEVPKSEGPNLSIKSSQDRVQEQSYHLKNEDDFPPLSLRTVVKIYKINRLSIILAANI